MPILTAIRPSRRRVGHLDLFIDDVLLGPVPELEVKARGLEIGSELDPLTVSALASLTHVAQALALANTFLGYRPRATAEVRRRLRQAHFDEMIIESAVASLTAQGLLDDQRFASLWVENRSSFSPRSSRALEMELRRKGVERESIAGALAESACDDQALAVEAGRKRLRAFATSDEAEFRRRMVGYLARRGFDHGTVEAAVSLLWQEVEQHE